MPGSCRTTPARAGPGDSREVTVTHHGPPGRILLPTPVTHPSRGSLPYLDPALQRSLGFPPFRLSASLRASLAPTLRCSLEVRRAVVSELTTGCANRLARSMAIHEIQTFSPSFFRSSPSELVSVPSSSPCRGVRCSALLTSQLFPPRRVPSPPRSRRRWKPPSRVRRMLG